MEQATPQAEFEDSLLDTLDEDRLLPAVVLASVHAPVFGHCLTLAQRPGMPAPQARGSAR